MVGEDGARPQTISERLNDRSARFLPIRIGERFELVNTDWIAYVACPGRTRDVAEREEVGAHCERAELDLAGGATLRGELLYELPPGHSRVSDLLNAPNQRFLLLVTETETLFVRRAAVRRARTG